MIQRMTRLVVADNSGAKKAMCIGYLGQRRLATVGSVISTTIKEAIPNSNVKKGEVHLALVVRQAKEYKRRDGRSIRFGENACILLGKDWRPLGTRVSGPVPLELRKTRYMKVMSLAPMVV